jgi:hypothetical protein
MRADVHCRWRIDRLVDVMNNNNTTLIVAFVTFAVIVGPCICMCMMAR